ncbi:GNAT family N-acetyltransferase [Acidianus ambivalens]|uniref:GNAT family N-acetyltransferase n=1 Tax=Acidianus ambivalens TaxID=2283 RepID=A0A650CUU5_ACIAM|nr:GNAT family N-acetyltransferase [Acidianus ambivalens]MQL55777.1 GNAT family N-acetyltransferase [Acidianus ambivalens]QGR21651.1 GNAT family N-acetyltransferase [Acidianus ambivalens]
MINALQIRKANFSDVEGIYNLYNSLSPDDLYMRFFSFTRLSEQDVVNLTKSSKVTLIAVIDSEIVGEISLYEDGEFSLVVKPEHRRKGIGTMLVKSIIEEAKKLGMTKVKFYTLPDNIPMIKIGKKLGFTLRFSSDEVFGILSLQ